jgi:hypothetical protein
MKEKDEKVFSKEEEYSCIKHVFSEPAELCEYIWTVNLCLVTIKYKNSSWTNMTIPLKYVFDFKE